jgi:hypothetical protein
MAKQIPVLPQAGGDVLMKFLGTVAVVALLTVVVRHPADAAAWAKNIGGLLATIVDGVAEFFRQLT